MQVPVHAQERVLAQLAGIVGVAHHAIDNVPAQSLVVADQRLEGAWRAGKHCRDQQAIGVDTGWLARTHPVVDTAESERLQRSRI